MSHGRKSSDRGWQVRCSRRGQGQVGERTHQGNPEGVCDRVAGDLGESTTGGRQAGRESEVR